MSSTTLPTQTTFVIRPATAADAAVVVDFNARLAEESEGRRLDQNVLAAGVAAALADATKTRYWLGCVNNLPVAQVMHTWEWSDWRNGYFWWIQSVYVVPAERGQGHFRRLYQHLRELALRDPQVIGLRLYVERHNTTALQTYTRLGMQSTGYEVLEDLFVAAPAQ